MRFGRQLHKDIGCQIRRTHLSPAYTTSWKDIHLANC
ncbi:DUF4113 domain-containing protein [Marinobacter sp. OP 3.4]